MREMRSADQSCARPPVSGDRSRSPSPMVLWRLRGATDDLRGLAIETSFGYALGLELDAELVLLHLQPSLESQVNRSPVLGRAPRVPPDTAAACDR